ncbi:UDP-N-acetylmuramate--L-alanine ligase [Nocardioidaceae bacterium]|nr:UDP-N-acetylmuramate--L-alanine ligase [Nocardioidaceae bacterium]
MRVDIPDRILAVGELGHVHFVGIGGAGLSGIARVMAARGVRVSGSDGADSATLAALGEAGMTVHVGHAADQLGDADTVVVSTAVKDDNPEVVAARQRGLRIWPRSAALQSVLLDKRALAVAGTHGKTTTTSLLTMALREAGVDPSFAVGGDLAQLGTNAADGAGPDFVVEADESDGAFLVYTPHAAVVTNVEADHLDNWGTEEAYARAFVAFLDRVEPGGFVVLCIDDPGARALAAPAMQRGLRVLSVGEAEDADLRAVDVRVTGGRSFFTVTARPDVGVPDVAVALQIPGRHYVLDALAALACGVGLGYDVEALARGLEGFTGTRRRMERKGEAGGVRVYDSYAHHPREITGDLDAARSLLEEGQRLIVCFQPHMVSRTRLLGPEMGAALGAADEVVILDTYAAREEPDPEVGPALVASGCPLPSGSVHLGPEPAVVPSLLAELARPGDVVLTLGAGDVTRLGPLVLDELASTVTGEGA